MKNLIIHLGYPKTATTTLQNSFFDHLNSDKRIKFLGRSNGDSADRDSFSNQLRDHLFRNNSMKMEGATFETDLPIVFSDEELTSPFLYMEKKYGSKGDPKEFPKRMFDLFSKVEDLNIKLVFVLRNQSDLIYSWYAQMFRFFISEKENTLTKHVFNNGDVLDERFEMYNFYDVIKEYSKVFGKENIQIELFENFKCQKPSYALMWSELLKLGEKQINKRLYTDHLNSKNKKGVNAVVTNINVVKPWTRGIMRIIPNRAKDYIKNIIGIDILLNIISGKKDNKKNIELVNFSLAEKEIIKEYFKEGNLKLIEEFGLKKDEFKQYMYI